MYRIFKSRIILCLLVSLPWGLLAQTAREIAGVSITVTNLERAIQFYEGVLHFKKTSEYTLNAAAAKSLFEVNENIKVATLKLGEESIELWECKTPGRAIPTDARSNDLSFQHIAIVVSDMEAAYQQLRKAKVQFVSTAPQTLPDYLPAAAGISAFYFRDLDGHNLEIIHFPKGKGNEKWQKPGDQVFLGIDHTAIGIGDTDSSLDFYDAALGLKVAGNSENYGSEQEHLNQVFGAHLIITGLKAQQGFGLEFLDYLSPPGGRLYPADSKVNDVWHWHTTLFTSDLNTLITSLKERTKARHGKISTFQHPVFGRVQALLLRDPDGHAILAVSPE